MGAASNLKLRVGIDIVAVERLERLVAENDGIVDTLFTDAEQEYCRGKRRSLDHLAARFAAKEAVLKAFGTGIGRRMRWTDVEVAHATMGRPVIRLHGEVASWAERRGLADLDVTLSPSAGVAVAHALTVWRDAEQEGEPCAST
jgi:holo-[acyl-carrier protein] synthase